MRYYVFAITILLSSQVYADNFTKQQCKELYQAWVLNSMLEETCQFGGALSYKLGVIAKNACGDMLSEAEVKQFALDVGRDLKEDYDRMGRERLCEDAKPGYEATVQEINR